jgi:peptide/nickel transport system substrate-binding protein
MLIPNVTHAPLNDAVIRRAMAYAIDYQDVRELAVSGYSEPLRPGLILPFGLEGKYFSEDDGRAYGTSYDPAKAKALLKEAGYTSVYTKDGDLVEMRDAAGHTLPTIYVKSPTGWSDWESIVGVVVKNLRDAGIDARERFVDANLYWHALYAGDFDLVMHQPAPSPTPSQPWGRLEEVLSSADWAPEGEKMYKNIGRFNNPAAPNYNPRISELLKTIPTLSDEAEILKAYRELNVIAMQAQPTLPLVYRPDQFYEVSVRHWDNFPSAKNPYGPPQIPGDRLGTEALWALRAVGSAGGGR